MKYRTQEARLILQLGIYIFVTNILEGATSLLQGLTYNEEGRLCLLKYRNTKYKFPTVKSALLLLVGNNHTPFIFQINSKPLFCLNL